MIVTCPYCSTRIVPMQDGICPACRKSLADVLGKLSGEEFVQAVAPAESASSTQEVPAAPPPPRSPPDPNSEDQQRIRFVAELHRLTPVVWVTPLIVAINVLIFVAMAIAARSAFPPGDMVLHWGANFGPKTLAGEWWRLFSSMFLHFGIVHVGLNMWVLWDLGQLVERLVGNIGFLVLYLLSGLAGCLASLAWNPGVISAGASGAVFGVCGALLGYLALQRDSVPPRILKSLQASMFSFVGYNLVFGLVVTAIQRVAPGSFGIDNAAHLGGLAGGFLCGLVLSQKVSRGAAAGRLVRGGVLAVVGGAAAVLGLTLLPSPLPDVDAEVPRIGELEATLMRTFNELNSQRLSGGSSVKESAEDMEQRVLKPWRAVRQRVESLESAPLANADAVREITHYFRLRESAIAALVAALRNEDDQAYFRYEELWKEADRILSDRKNSRQGPQ